MTKPIRVLVVEDSATIRHHLTRLIEDSPVLTVAGQARNGSEALALVHDLKPDVVSMDIRMPQMDGFESTRCIMAQWPTPVVIVSGLVDDDVQMAFRALDAGALAVVAKPPHRDDPQFPARQHHFIRTLTAMAGVRVIRRTPPPGRPTPLPERVQPEVIAIGASAGGPKALQTLLGALPGDFPVPVVVAQHIPAEFVDGLVRWLAQGTALAVRRARDGAVLEPGVVHLSSGDTHLQVIRAQDTLAVRLLAEQGDHRYQPSVDVLFESVAAACGTRAVGVVLTGMGDDGARGLLAMRRAGARTFAQDAASAIVFGMPGAAIAQGAVQQVVSLAELPAALLRSL